MTGQLIVQAVRRHRQSAYRTIGGQGAGSVIFAVGIKTESPMAVQTAIIPGVVRGVAASFAIVFLTSSIAAKAAPETDQTPPAGLAWFVLNEINSFYLDREDPTDRPPLVTEVPAGVLVPVNVNNDGLSDWLINWPESSQFCGTGGCERTLYVSKVFAPGETSDVDGHERAFVLSSRSTGRPVISTSAKSMARCGLNRHSII